MRGLEDLFAKEKEGWRCSDRVVAELQSLENADQYSEEESDSLRNVHLVGIFRAIEIVLPLKADVI